MKKYVNLFVFVFMIGACLSQGRAQTKSAVSYKNPVVDIAMPDPTVIKAADGYFYRTFVRVAKIFILAHTVYSFCAV